MNLRVLREEDRERYNALLLRGLRDSPQHFRITPADVSNHPSPLEPGRSDAFSLGAFEENENLTGVVSVARETGEKMRYKALLFRMYVAPEYAGRGIGRALIAQAVRLGAAIPDVEQIQLTVLADNTRAKRLYEHFGFASFSLEKQAVKWGGRTFDEERMVLRVS